MLFLDHFTATEASQITCDWNTLKFKSVQRDSSYSSQSLMLRYGCLHKASVNACVLICLSWKDRSISSRDLNLYRAMKTLSCKHGHGAHSSQMTVHGTEREANKSFELNDMLPKQKHTFVILFPAVSILVDVLPGPCPRITAQQLSEAQSRGEVEDGG